LSERGGVISIRALPALSSLADTPRSMHKETNAAQKAKIAASVFTMIPN